MSASPDQVTQSPLIASVPPNGAGGDTRAEVSTGLRRAARPRTRAHILGEIVILLGQSPAHRHVFVSDLDWLVGPAMALGQFRVIYSKRGPIAFVLWASVSEEVEREFLHGRIRLRPDEWKSGDRLWLIELVAPSFANDAEQGQKLLANVARDVFEGRPFKMLRLNPETRLSEAVEVASTPEGVA